MCQCFEWFVDKQPENLSVYWSTLHGSCIMLLVGGQVRSSTHLKSVAFHIIGADIEAIIAQASRFQFTSAVIAPSGCYLTQSASFHLHQLSICHLQFLTDNHIHCTLCAECHCSTTLTHTLNTLSMPFRQI